MMLTVKYGTRVCQFGSCNLDFRHMDKESRHKCVFLDSAWKDVWLNKVDELVIFQRFRRTIITVNSSINRFRARVAAGLVFLYQSLNCHWLLECEVLTVSKMRVKDWPHNEWMWGTDSFMNSRGGNHGATVGHVVYHCLTWVYIVPQIEWILRYSVSIAMTNWLWKCPAVCGERWTESEGYINADSARCANVTPRVLRWTSWT